MKLLIEKAQNLMQLYINQVRMLLSAEEQILKGLEKMRDAATDIQLQEAFQSHRQETKVHVTRLKNILTHTAGEVDDTKCKTIAALIHEGEELIHECDGTLRDVALIAAAQRIEHYEIAAYGALRSFAKCLDLEGEAEDLNQTLQEEGHADQLLSGISDRLNAQAATLP
jgi:ferritin-like metal-binding protein YciE